MILKLIPNTKGFYASDTGLIFDSEGNERNYYRNGDGYITASVKLLNGNWRTFGVQRLVALTHIPTTEDPINLTVNHIDGNIENNHVSNLEFISVGLNIIHAALLRGDSTRPTILAKRPDGSHELIANLQDACDKFGCDFDIVWGSIRDNTLLDGWTLAYLDNNSKLPRDVHKPVFPFKNAKQPIKMLNIESKEILSFPSMFDAGKHFDVKPNHIFLCLSKKDNVRLFKQLYLIVKDGEEFPVLTPERYEELTNIGGKDVMAYNVTDKQYYIFQSAAEFIRYSKLSRKAVTVDLRRDRLREVDGWIYTYLTTDKTKRLKDFVSVQGNR